MFYNVKKFGFFFTLTVLLLMCFACSQKATVDPGGKAAVSSEDYEKEATARREAAEREAAEREAAIKEMELEEWKKVEGAKAEFDPSKTAIPFSFDNYSLTEEAREILAQIGAWLSKHPAVKIQIEGHCCELGTNEYNLALGEMRARSAKKYLIALGINKSRISTISYGEERPIDRGHLEEERAKNRRDQFVIISR